MPAGNRREARREWQLDVEEGADALLVKPALTNLDLIRDLREQQRPADLRVPGVGRARDAGRGGGAGADRLRRAPWTSRCSRIRRAGADVIVSYDTRTLAGVK